ncbi:BURP domain-containing protein 5-like [Dorcoceras hygrometricum]|uniref:BURP domain-containing protein 5-like n=1 Tax=Dorcoceras hygrometricum TaxID=472368 RepID=A0A2Z7D1V3_9LAMI|nr:BURP domain-containing protein 5-like [Dorcoceras hygrometricum]
MASQFAPLIFLLYCLFLHQSCLQLSEARVRNLQKEEHGDDHLRLGVENGDVIDPEMNVFFHHNDLVIGNRILIYFPRKDRSASPRFLSREESESIPFSRSQFPEILDFFKFPSDSEQAEAMKMTLHHCEAKPIKGERKICATSLESMLDFVQAVFGSGSKFQVLNTEYLTESFSPLQNYTVREDPSEIPAPELVSCHRLPYPYAVFYCHAQAGDTVVYKDLLEGDDGGRVDSAAICHMDTSEWDPKHAGFRVLNTRPGAAPVCHFFPVDSLVFIPK